MAAIEECGGGQEGNQLLAHAGQLNIQLKPKVVAPPLCKQLKTKKKSNNYKIEQQLWVYLFSDTYRVLLDVLQK